MNCHPLAALFPLMEGEEFRKLVESIKAHGQIDPIVMQGNLIVDGRNRQRACDKLGLAVTQVQFETLALKCSIPEYIWDKNRLRRDLTDDQKAMIEIEWAKQYKDEGLAAKSEGGKKSAPGRPSKDVNERSHVSTPRAPTTRKKMAAEAGVSERKMQQAATVKENAPELAEDIKAGKLPLAQAVKRAEAKKDKAPKVPKPKPKFDPAKIANGLFLLVREKLLKLPPDQHGNVADALIEHLTSWRVSLS